MPSALIHTPFHGPGCHSDRPARAALRQSQHRSKTTSKNMQTFVNQDPLTNYLATTDHYEIPGSVRNQSGPKSRSIPFFFFCIGPSDISSPQSKLRLPLIGHPQCMQCLIGQSQHDRDVCQNCPYRLANYQRSGNETQNKAEKLSKLVLSTGSVCLAPFPCQLNHAVSPLQGRSS